MCVPSASFGGFASTLATWSGSVVSGSATVGFALKNTTDSGCPGLRAVNARAAAIAEAIEFLMLFDVSISRTVPIPFAAAADWTATPSIGLPSSVTVTSLFVSTPRGSANVRTYARSGKSAEPASTTSTPAASSPSSAARTGVAANAQAAATSAGRIQRIALIDAGPPRWPPSGDARRCRRAGRSRASRTCAGRRAGDRSP